MTDEDRDEARASAATEPLTAWLEAYAPAMYEVLALQDGSHGCLKAATESSRALRLARTRVVGRATRMLEAGVLGCAPTPRPDDILGDFGWLAGDAACEFRAGYVEAEPVVAQLVRWPTSNEPLVRSFAVEAMRLFETKAGLAILWHEVREALFNGETVNRPFPMDWRWPLACLSPGFKFRAEPIPELTFTRELRLPFETDSDFSERHLWLDRHENRFRVLKVSTVVSRNQLVLDVTQVHGRGLYEGFPPASFQIDLLAFITSHVRLDQWASSHARLDARPDP